MVKIDFLNGTSEEVYQGWKDLGLLDGLSEDVSKELAGKFTEMGKYLIETKINFTDDISYLVFPILRFCVSNGTLRKNYTPEVLCNFLMDTKDVCIRAISRLGVDDAEAEYAAWVSEFFKMV